MTPSDELKAFTKRSEGCRLTAYPDNGACSIGYGHRGVLEGTVWTQAMADLQFENDIAIAGHLVLSLVSVPLTQGQFDALVDFVYNEGSEHLRTSTLLKALNLGRYAQVPSELYRIDPETGEARGWIFSQGKVNPGLIARRLGEIRFWEGNQ